MSASQPQGTDGPDRQDWLVSAALLGAALWGRLWFLLSSPDRAWPHSAWFQGDATLWADWAAALSQGQEFERGLAVHAPAVAYLLHWLGYGAGPADFTAAKVVWCVCSALACPLTYLAVRLEAGRRIAGLAAALLAFSFASYVTATSLNGEALYSMLLPLIAIGTWRLHRRPSVLVAGATGVAHGLATLLRPEHTLLLLLLLAYSAWRWRGTLTRVRPALRTTAVLAAIAAGALAPCLPWSIATARATVRFNTVAPPIEYARSAPPWSDDARAAFESLPAFARHDNFEYLTYLARQRGVTPITAETVRAYFRDEFGSWPEPLRTWNLVSGQGALSFALANHPGATGGFSKAGLDARFSADPALNFGQASHLYLYNHGYRAGLESIRRAPGRWTSLVRAKLAIFAQGATQGFTALNLPLGRSGVRRAVDLFTAESPGAPLWRATLGGLIFVGAFAAVRRRIAAVWLLVVGYKLVVTGAFYGYARQAASILPALMVLEALGLHALATLVGTRFPACPAARVRWRPLAWIIPVLALMAIDAARMARPPGHTGNAWPSPRWGPGAFESFNDVRLAPPP